MGLAICAAAGLISLLLWTFYSSQTFFLGAEQANVRKSDGDVELEGETEGQKEAHVKGRQDRITLSKDGRKVVVDFRQDQFGETLPLWYPVFLNATNWANGARSATL